MKPKTKWTLTTLKIIAWVILIGLYIKTGALLFSFIISLFINSVAAENLHLGLNLSTLYKFSMTHYVVIVSIMLILLGLKAHLFQQVVKIFLKINFVHPFSKEVSSLISGIGYVALGIGILTVAGNMYCDWLIKQGVVFPDLQGYLSGAGEFLLLGGIIFMIAEVFKRGIEIQTENELTV